MQIKLYIYISELLELTKTETKIKTIKKCYLKKINVNLK